MSFSFEPMVGPESAVGSARGHESQPAVDVRPLELPELDGSAVVRSAPLPGQEDLEERLQRAQAAAHHAGFEEGRRAEAMRVATAIEAVKALVLQLEREDERRSADAVERVAVLATAIAGHLVGREVRSSPEIISDLIRRAVAEFPVSDALRVHLNPSDLALLSSGLGEDSGRTHLTSGQSVRWIPDPAVQSGGCLVEGSEQVVDARLSRALERIARALVNA